MLKQKYREERDRKLAVYKLHKEKIIDKKLADIKVPGAGGTKTDFERVVAMYADNVKMMEKVAFPHRMSEKEVRAIRGGARESNLSTERTMQKESFIFGKQQHASRKKGSKKTNLKDILDRLQQIEAMLEA